MSVKVMGAVWDLPASEIEPRQKYVLLAYADHADHTGRNVFPSIALIARKTGYDERSVQRITRELEALGFLIAEGGQAGGRAMSAHWRIPLNGDKLSPFPIGERVTNEPLKGDTPEADLPVKGDKLSPEYLTEEPNLELENESDTSARILLLKAIDQTGIRADVRNEIARAHVLMLDDAGTPAIVVLMPDADRAEFLQEYTARTIERALTGVVGGKIPVTFRTEASNGR